MLIAFTASVIVPDVVIGVPLTVNSDEPLSATATVSYTHLPLPTNREV